MKDEKFLRRALKGFEKYPESDWMREWAECIKWVLEEGEKD